MANTKHFDLCVIGAGSAGLSLVAGAAQLKSLIKSRKGST